MRTLLAELVWDARYTVRQLRRAPGFSLTVLLTLALAVGATAAMTGVLRATLLNPLPYPHADQLVEVGDRNLRQPGADYLMSVLRTADLSELQHDGHKVFSDFSFFYFNNGQLSLQNHEPLRASSAAVSGDFFKTVAAAPLLGRTLTPADDLPNAPLVTVLSYRLWASVFSSDRAILGRSVRLGNDQATVVGVMPETFTLPAGVDLWYPGHISAARFGGYRGDGSRFVHAVVRLAPGESFGSVKQQAELLAAQLARAYPQTDAVWGFKLTSLRDGLFGDYREVLLLLASAVALVLVVTIVNIAGLQLSRNAVREPEFAVRTALGVSRERLARQLLTETVLLVCAGSLAGVALGWLLLQGLATRLPAALLRVETPHLDAATLVICSLLALGIGLLTGIVPALQSTRASLAKGARELLGIKTRRFGAAFTVVQVAAALVVLTLSAGVLGQLYRLLHVPLGFQTTHVESCTVDLPWSYEVPKRHRLYGQIEASIAGMPGVASVGAIQALPLTRYSERRTFDIAGQPSTARNDAVVAEGRSFTPAYLRTMGIPLLQGRAFTAQDGEEGRPSVVLINHTLAERYFPGKDPVGQRLLGGRGISGKDGASEIVGVIGDVRGTSGGLADTPQPEVYDPGDDGWPHMQFAIRSALPPVALAAEVRRAVAALDGAASVGPVTALADTIDQSLQQPRWSAALLSAFAGLSLLLVVVGVYGLVAFQVTQRSRELALRLALGATRGGVLGLVLRESARLLAAGFAVGAAGSWAAARLFAAGFGGLAGVFPGEAAHIAAIALPTGGLLAVAVLGATLLPALRASAIDPAEVLRTE